MVINHSAGWVTYNVPNTSNALLDVKIVHQSRSQIVLTLLLNAVSYSKWTQNMDEIAM